MIDLTVIVVGYNTRALTLQAVAAARKATAGLDARVIVADNGSDGTAEAVRDADPDVTVLVNADNPGYGTPQASAKRFPTLGLALGEVIGVHAVAPRNRWVRRFYYEDLDLAREPRVETISGAVMLLRADAFDAIGRFDEGFRMYF